MEMFKNNGELNKYGETLKTRLQELIKNAKRLNNKEVVIHTYTSYKDKGYITIKDERQDYIKLAKHLNIKYELGNDAPRGGKVGEFIKFKIDNRVLYFKNITL